MWASAALRTALRRPLASVPLGQQAARRWCASAAKPKPKPALKGKKQQMGMFPIFAGSLVGGTAVAYQAGLIADEDTQKAGEFFEDLNDTVNDFLESVGEYFVAPKSEPWLLDLSTMKYPENIPTLVIDLDKVVVHLEHDRKAGWRVIKRPGADQFFKELQHYYELVVFSDEVYPISMEVMQKWGVPVTGVLHRDFCKKRKKHYIKDVSKLGRRMDRVVVVDHDPEAFSQHPENGVAIRPFTGDLEDRELYDLLDFLKACATERDTRKMIEKFGGGDEDIGRRYLVHKNELDQKAQKQRGLGRKFLGGGGARMGNGGFNTSPGFARI